MVTAQMVKDLRESTGAGMLDCKKALQETNGDIDKAIDYLREKGISKASKKNDRIAAEGLTIIKTKENKAIIMEVNSETDFVAQNTEFTNMINFLADKILNSDAKNIEQAKELSTDEGTIADYIIAKTAKIGEKLSLRRFEIINKKENESFGEYSHMGGKISSLVVLENANEEIAKDVAMHVAAMNPKYISEDQVSAEEIEKEKKVLTEQAMNEGKPVEIAEKMVEGRIKKFFKEICLNDQQFIKDSDKTVKEYVKENKANIKSIIRYEVGEGMEKRSENFAEEVMQQVNK